MVTALAEHNDASDEFSYQDSNDSLGDLLKEKRNYQFSWLKTVSVLCVLVGGIFVSLMFLFTVGKQSLIDKEVVTSDVKRDMPVAIKPGVASKKMTQQLKQAIQESAKKQMTSSVVSVTDKPPKKFVKHPNIDDELSKIKVMGAVKEVAPVLVNKKTVSRVNKPVRSPKKAPRVAKQAAVLSYKVIAGTFSKKLNAKTLQKSLALKKIRSFIWVKKGNTSSLYKVQVGAFGTRKEAEGYRKKISRKGVQSYIFYKK